MEKDQLLGRVIWDVFPTLEGRPGIREKIQVGQCKPARPRRFVGYFADLGPVVRRGRLPPRPRGLSVYFQDVTDLRREQEQLRLLDAAAARINDVVIITEVGSGAAPAHHKIVYVNDAYRTADGLHPRRGDRPDVLSDAGATRPQRAELDRIRQALARFEPVTAEVINYTKSGREYWVELDIVPIADAAGAFTHFVSVQRRCHRTPAGRKRRCACPRRDSA